MITGPSTTWCQVNDMGRAIAFYRDVLGLPVLLETTHWSELQFGPVKLALHLRLNPGSDACGIDGKGWYVGMACDDVAALRAAVIAGGGSERGYHDVPGGVVLTFGDPDGNPLQAFQAGITVQDVVP